MALGFETFVNKANATAIGGVSSATGGNATAIGYQAGAAGNSATSVGSVANAAGFLATAVGREASAGGTGATAVGYLANAAQTSATAIGQGATTTAANQVTIGGTGSSVRVGDIDASTLAQVGPVNAVTVDASGTLGKGAVASAAQLSSLQGSMARALAVSDAQFNQLSGRVDSLFDLATHDCKESRRGVAAAMAMADAPMPSEPGKTSYAAKGSTFRGEFAVGASLSHRLDTGSPFALTASLSHAGGKNTGASVGFSGEF